MISVDNSDLKRIVECFGSKKQTGIAQEELAELIVAISKVNRYGLNIFGDNLYEEIADVIVMIGQLRIIFDLDDALLQEWIDKKIDRTLKHVERIENVERIYK